MRIGYGYDVHRLVKGRKLIVGGVHIPFKKGLLGHSDADVLVHAVCDAILGSACLGDIGLQFPDTNTSFKDINSMILLEKSCDMLRANGFTIINIDTTLIAQAPSFSSYRDAMRQNISSCTGLDIDRINIKFTTTERLGFIGKGKGMAAMCVALIEKNHSNESLEKNK